LAAKHNVLEQLLPIFDLDRTDTPAENAIEQQSEDSGGVRPATIRPSRGANASVGALSTSGSERKGRPTLLFPQTGRPGDRPGNTSSETVQEAGAEDHNARDADGAFSNGG
jgi:hypothetical protein